MTAKDFVKLLQKAMNSAGSKLTVDGDFGPVSQGESDKYEFIVTAEKKVIPLPPKTLPNGSINPAYMEAKKYAGKGENDKAFVAWLSKFWPKTGLNYKTIIGASFAWCGLFIAAMNSETGLDIVKGAAGAKNWAKSGVEIEWKVNGIPRGAVMHLNRNKCGSGSGNHVTFADGDCSAGDLKKSGAVVPGFGGNQANKVKRSLYPVKEVCSVRWPAEIEKPGPITQSVDCSGASSGGESTR